MSVEYRTGDIFTSDAQALAHGCNCQGVMGAGIATQFKARYPEMYWLYRAQCTKGVFTPGYYYAFKADNGKLILNLATQDYPGKHARYEWIESSLRAVLKDFPELKSIALPRIGCGIGGLTWERVKAIIETIGNETEINLIVYSL